MANEEQAPIIGLMRQCWLHGVDTQYSILGERLTEPLGGNEVPDIEWEKWWTKRGRALMERYHQATYVAKPGLREVMRVSNETHRLVTANHAMLTTMIEAMQEMEPDDTVDEEGEVWTLTAETPDGISLVRTVRCLTMTTAIATATKAWGHGLWESLRKRRAVCED